MRSLLFIRGGNKFKAKKTIVDGVTFASMAEAKHYNQLKVRVMAGEIKDLELQPTFKLMVNGAVVCKYIADFEYTDTNGRRVVVDVKGCKKGAAYAVFRVKWKLVQALYPDLVFLEVG